MPAGRNIGLAYVCDFLERVKQSGEVQRMLDRQGAAGVFMAPAAAAK